MLGVPSSRSVSTFSAPVHVRAANIDTFGNKPTKSSMNATTETLRMRKLILSAIAAFSLITGAAAAQAAQPLVVGVDHPGDALLEKTQYVYLGHDYCWYGGGWHGPGFYW